MKTILIVEDDRPLSQGIQMALRQSGREIRLAHTLAAARDALDAGGVDLVILDVNLPDGSGLALLEELRRTSDLPVLILSANDMEMDQVAGLELGADDYVTKPFSLAILRARVGNLLRRWNFPPSPSTSRTCSSPGTARRWNCPRPSSGCCGCWWRTGGEPCPGRCCWTGCGTAGPLWLRTPCP